MYPHELVYYECSLGNMG